MVRAFLVPLMIASLAMAAMAQDGWAFLVEFNGGTYYTRPASPTVTYRRIELRVEHKSDFFGRRSSVKVFEVDCEGRRLRKVEDTGYPEPELKGASIPGPASSNWEPAPPRSINDRLVTLACA